MTERDDTAPPADDPLADVEPGDAHPGYNHLVVDDGNHDACENEGPRVEGWGWGGRTCCTRPVGHVGQHIATAPGRAVIATWPTVAGPRAGDTARDDGTPEQFRDRMLALLDAAGAATRCGNRLHWYLNGPEHRIAHALEIMRSEAAALRAAGDALAGALDTFLLPGAEDDPEAWIGVVNARDAWRSAAGSPTTDGKAPADESAAAGPEGAPRANWSGAWAELTGYVRAASSPIDPDRLDVYLTELKRKALRPVREWMENVMAGQPVRDSQDGGDRA